MTIKEQFQEEIDGMSRNAFSRLTQCEQRAKETTGRLQGYFLKEIAELKHCLGEWERGDFAGKKVYGE